MPGTALDKKFQNASKLAWGHAFLADHMPFNKDYAVILCLSTVQEKVVFLNYAGWLAGWFVGCLVWFGLIWLEESKPKKRTFAVLWGLYSSDNFLRISTHASRSIFFCPLLVDSPLPCLSLYTVSGYILPPAHPEEGNVWGEFFTSVAFVCSQTCLPCYSASSCNTSVWEWKQSNDGRTLTLQCLLVY